MSRVSTLRLPFVTALAAVLLAAPALAQSSSCQDAQKFLNERQSLIQQISKLGGKDKKVDPRAACAVLIKLVSNGEAGIKWLDVNKDWCQVPDQFIQSFKQDHGHSKELKAKACKAAAPPPKQGDNPFGGGLEGEYKIPKGAL